jgi:hypothetical protein
MDELQISGKRFISSRRIARENGYTSDYIGQLIRGGKVKGQKVGRAWYVDAASFDLYLGGEGAAEAAPKSVPESVSAPVAAEPIQEEAPAEETIVVEAAPEPEPESELVPAEVEAPAVEEKAVEEVEEKISETRIPLHVVVQKVEEEREPEAAGALRYFADDAPALPQILQKTSELRVPEREVSAIHVMSAAAFAPMQSRRFSRAGVTTLAFVAIAVFALSALASSITSLNLSIEAGNAANVYYTLDF